jgi:hypothetical protein
VNYAITLLKRELTFYAYEMAPSLTLVARGARNSHKTQAPKSEQYQRVVSANRPKVKPHAFLFATKLSFLSESSARVYPHYEGAVRCFNE